MAKKKFIAKDWLSLPSMQEPSVDTVTENLPIANEDVQALVQEIENRKLDVTSEYATWRDIGFAISSSFGEEGRSIYHRISCFYPGYNISDCDDQYNKCLKANGSGITIGTFFHHAKLAGVTWKSTEKSNVPTNNKVAALPVFGSDIYEQLPEFLQEVISIAVSDEERDILILASVVSLSACLPKLFGIYDGRKCYTNLYLFVTAQASAGKGRMIHCKQLVKPVHTHLREQAKALKLKYEMDMLDYNELKGNKDTAIPKPNRPPEKMLFIPANNSTTGVYQLLSDNDNKGLMFETEGDTLAQAFKTDYGNYSEGFRKAFHHETISYYRRTDREYVDMENPCLSTVLSGTPRQVATLIPNAENGLFSRFIFYFMKLQPVWKDVFAYNNNTGLDDFFDQLGDKFYSLYQLLSSGDEIQFILTAEQQVTFNQTFDVLQRDCLNLQGLEYIATVRRLGLVAFRLSMVLSSLRIMEHGEVPVKIICEQRDFHSVLEIVKVLVQHSAKVYSELPQEKEHPKRKNQKERFYDAIPNKFNHKEFTHAAAVLGIPAKTAQGYISDFIKIGMLHRDKKDCYLKPELPKVEETGELPNHY